MSGDVLNQILSWMATVKGQSKLADTLGALEKFMSWLGVGRLAALGEADFS